MVHDASPDNKVKMVIFCGNYSIRILPYYEEKKKEFEEKEKTPKNERLFGARK